ncbi:DUF6602 domain-containing protein [Streptomyces calvus]|uniref:DUF6602 domain-containing protein n=1 Tax=Streptomyces calvus TaxID=67282 RepID=UPI0037229723
MSDGAAESSQPHDLLDFMNEVSHELQFEYERITRRSKQDPGTAGDEGESLWKEILSGWLPRDLPVVTKGRILGADGNSSPQVDVLVLHSGYPEKLIAKKQYLAGGVLAAFECKLTLRKRDMAKIGENARAVRKIAARAKEDSPYAALHSPIIYGVLANSSEWSTREDVLKVDSVLAELFASHSQPQDVLDVMCIADLACWTRFVTVACGPPYWPADLWEKSRNLYGWPEEGAVHDQYSRWMKMEGVDDSAPNSIYVLISKLLRRIAWEIPQYRGLAEYWNIANVPGRSGGAGAVRNWPLFAMPDEIVQQVRLGGLTNGVRWSPWGTGYH